jgi:lipoprotein NlpD
MTKRGDRRWQATPTLWMMVCVLVGVSITAGCASPRNHAPVEDRNNGSRAATAAPSAAAAASAPALDAAALKPLPGAENAGKPGYYTVKPGDTLIRVGLENGQNWKDLVRWNGMDNPNIIEVGQVLRVVPPGTDATTAGTRPVTQAKVETRPLDAKPVANGASAPSASAVSSAASAPAVVTAPLPAVASASARDADDDIPWIWPAAGPVATPFNEGSSKGLAITGKAGDPVLAAADGRVVYAGSGLRAYGNLVILKHNSTYLTAYAHNQTLLVKEDQSVRRGQKIAEMGSSDADRVQLHFEIRKQGKPIDPAKLLPPR